MTMTILNDHVIWASIFEDAVAAQDRGEYKSAMKMYLELAAKDYPKAQFKIGVMYSKGQSVVKDYSESIKWYRLAAAQGDAKAQSNLGLMYFNGQGVNQD